MRVRLLALLSAAALFGLAVVPASASSEGHSYLALGDSVPFGFNPLADPTNANNFVGYPEIVAQRLNIEDVNATCPGEATGGFLSLTGTDNGCRTYRFFYKLPLHVDYPGTQMDFALAYLRSHRATRLVTLTLGANDAFVFLHEHPACAAIAPPSECGPLLAGLFATIGANLNTILSKIRGAGYSGLIVAVTYYATDYRNPTDTVLLNQTMIAAAAANGAFIASGFDAWAPTALAPPANGDSCVAGLLIQLPPGSPTPCDVHPTPLGRDLLAAAVANAIAASCPAHSATGCLNRHRA